MNEIKLGKYMHYKGTEHEVIGVAKHSEDDTQEFVIYHHINTEGVDQLYARPKQMFLENVMIDGKQVPRFVYIGE